MKFNKKLAIAAAVALASTGANAAWESGGTGSSANAINAELVLTVYNVDTQRSFTQDLGVTTLQFMQNAAGSQNFNLSAEGLSFIGSGNIRYSVAGNHSSALQGLDNFGYYFTSNQAPQVNESQTFANFQTQFQAFARYENALGDADAGTADDPVFFLDGQFYAGSGATWGTQLNSLTANIGSGVDATAGDGEALMAWTIGMQQDVVGTNVKQNAATWLLDTSTGTLAYSEVPVPAAAWLFGSALLGMAGAARRRKTIKA